MVALNVAEVVKTKLEAIRGLKRLVQAGELEKAVRDYVAEKPYLLAPEWETFRRESSVKHLMDEAAKEAKLEEDSEDAERTRIDLALRSNEHLLVVEFMRPGKTLDYDHLSRCRAYVTLVKMKVENESALGIRRVTGLVVADNLGRSALVSKEIDELKKSNIYVYSWNTLIAQAERTWRDFLDIVGERAPADERLKSLRETAGARDH